MRAAAAVAAMLALAGCGGTSAEDEARDRFEEYRAAQAVRGEAELDLRAVFGDIAEAARARSAAGVGEAVARGRAALATIDRSFDRELAAAHGLEEFDPTAAEARKLVAALEQSRSGLGLVARQLDIAVQDPFLDQEANADEVRRLSRESQEVAVPAAFARRRAAHAIALALGVEPPFDPMFDEED